MIEGALGEKGIFCVEDLVHELNVAGNSFAAATAFLWPFKLRPPKIDSRHRNSMTRKARSMGIREKKLTNISRSCYNSYSTSFVSDTTN